MHRIAPGDLRDVHQEMQSAERPRWIGRPAAARTAIRYGYRSFLFGALWLFICLRHGVNLGPPIRPGPLLAQLALVAIGVAWASSPLREYLRARRMLYVVTNQRVVILDRFRQRSTISLTPGEIGPVKVKAGPKGRGTILFKQNPDADPEQPVPAFRGIDQVRLVEHYISHLQDSPEGS
jgi:hypothetical protein